MEALRIVALSVLAAVTYGVLHDQVTARMCLEYFTVAHPDVVGHEPTIIALYRPSTTPGSSSTSTPTRRRTSAARSAGSCSGS